MSKMSLLCVLCSLLVVSVMSQTLPSLNIDLKQSSVSGLSSGGAMAVQLHVSHSSLFVGAGIFAGIGYDCAQGSIETAEMTCMYAMPSGPSFQTSVNTANSRASTGLVDDTKNLSNVTGIFLFTGTQDNTVHKPVMDAVNAFYAHYLGWNALKRITYVTNVDAGHTFPTDNPQNTESCAATQSPYISNCGFDGAGLALQKIYGTLNPRNNGTLSGKVIEFLQKPYIPYSGTPASVSMEDIGLAYVPNSCASGQPCRLHIAFHGCAQTLGDIGTLYATNTGFNAWADTNNIVVLYPQASRSPMMENPEGCWNWWGYANNPTTYDTNQGYQIMAVKAMMDALATGAKF